MKKLISILLLICMAFSAALLTSCQSAETENPDETSAEGEEENIDTHTAMTLTMWLPTDKNTTKDAVAKVEEALNKITQSKYNTAIKLYAVPDEEYETAVNDYITAVTESKKLEAEEAAKRREEARKNKKNGNTETTAETAAETLKAADNSTASEIMNKYGVSSIATAEYPSVEKNQMDIFLVRGYDNYNKYVNDNLLEPLDEELATGAKKITTYVYPTFLSAAKVLGQTFAIPNNHPLGEYQYILINKRIADAENINAGSIVTVDRLMSSGIITATASNYAGVTPFYGTIDPYGYQFWSSDSDADFSVLASRVLSDTDMASVAFRNIFSYNDYINTLANYKSLRESGYVSTDDSVAEFGAAVISGTPADVEKYEDDYYINVLYNPVATMDDVFQAAFAVSVYTKDTTRSMEIITLLNTDTEFRTILQYGIEGTHWKKSINDSNVIEILSDDYKMELVNTGNVYMTYPEEGVSMDYWEKAKKQNLDSYMPITITFAPANYVNDDTKALLAELETISAQYKARLDAMTSAELRESAPQISAELSSMELLKKLTYVPVENDHSTYDPTQSVANLWTEFYLDNLAEPEQ